MSTVELLITLTIHLGLLQFLNTFFLIPITLLLICNELIPIEKIFSSRDSIRKAREATLIIRAKTIDTNSLNARDERH